MAVTDPPEWFDADFRAMIPRELLVGVPPMIWEVHEEAEEVEGLGAEVEEVEEVEEGGAEAGVEEVEEGESY